MKRYLCAYFPQWSINIAQKQLKKQEQQVLQKQQERRPIFITHKSAQQILIQQSCRQGHAHGVLPGMSLALAQAICPNAQAFPFSPEKDFRLLVRVARWALRYTPLVGIDNDLVQAFRKKELITLSPLYHGLILDLTGTERLYHGEENVARSLFEYFKKAGIHARIAIGPTIGSAWACSRFMRTQFSVVHARSLKDSLASLPIAALRISEKDCNGLHDLGLFTLQDLYNLPQKTLLTRFGYHVLQRLDQLFGAVEEQLIPIRSQEGFHVTERYDSPLCTQKSAATRLVHLLEKLLEQLLSQKKRARSFVIKVESINHDFTPLVIRKELALSTATQRLSHLISVLEPVIESIHMPEGIHALSVEATGIEQQKQSQSDFFRASTILQSEQARGELLNHLTAHLSTQRVCQMSTHQSHVPERSFSFEPVARHALLKTTATTPPIDQIRPNALFSPPQPIHAISLMPDHPPSWIRWNSKRYRILSAHGPERITEEWWHSALDNLETSALLNARDYFTVQDDRGRWWWLYRENSSQEWFLHGLWG